VKAWGIEVNECYEKKITKAIEEDKKIVKYERTKMMAFAMMMSDMLEHLEIEVKYGFITEKERRKIMEGMKLIADVYKDQKKDEIEDRIDKLGAKRIKEKFGHLVTVKEVDTDELGSGS
jgi:argininosuccinate lyase